MKCQIKCQMKQGKGKTESKKITQQATLLSSTILENVHIYQLNHISNTEFEKHILICSITFNFDMASYLRNMIPYSQIIFKRFSR